MALASPLPAGSQSYFTSIQTCTDEAPLSGHWSLEQRELKQKAVSQKSQPRDAERHPSLPQPCAPGTVARGH